MKTEKELLKIYSAYLPYELKVKSYLTDTEFIVKGISFRGSLQNEEGYDMTNIERAKPIIYSMDMLTKEIEHKGERFIPMIQFIKKTSLFDLSKCAFEVYEDDGEVYVNAHDGDRVIDSIYYDGNIFWSSKLLDIHEGYRPANPQHIWQEMLLELNFNVFGLEESEYIKKENLK